MLFLKWKSCKILYIYTASNDLNNITVTIIYPPY